MTGLREAAQRFGFELGQVTSLMHGTTIATNAVLEGKLPRGALVTTAGFRDVLEIGRHVRREIYAAVAEPRRLLIDRENRFEVRERVAPDGRVLVPLDEAEAQTIAEQIAACGAQAVAVCLLHAYTNPVHEKRLGEILGKVLEYDFISLSHAVSPEPREFERTSTTALNALLMPVVKSYLLRLQERMKEENFHPSLFLVQSNGGVTTPEAAAEQPVRLLLSGPSGGALAAQNLGRRLGEPNLVAMDMGGTSFDVSIVHQGRTRLVTEGTVDGCPVRVPMVEIRTIGAGGGSIAHADETGRLHVGPESAGAVPGPVAYARGGMEPTVTDANVALGRIDPDYFLGGGMKLNAEGALSAIRNRIATPLDLNEAQAAEGIVRIAIANMTTAIRLSLFEKGLDPKYFSLISFGGAGGLHAAEVAGELGIRRVVYPRDAGTLSAYGILFSDVVHDGARSRLLRLEPEVLPGLNTLAADLAEEGRLRLERDGIPLSKRHFDLAADMRYEGQAYEIVVPFESSELDIDALKRALAQFHDLHETRYAHCDPDETPEMVTLRLKATGVLRKPRERDFEPGPEADPKSRRRVYLNAAWTDSAVYARSDIGPGFTVDGPAIVEEEHATILLPSNWRLTCTPSGALVADSLGGEP